MNAFEKWMQGLDWTNELIVQRETILKSVMTEQQLNDRAERMLSYQIKEKPKQLNLFEL